MTEKSIIIIGAGIAGLAAGCYAQMNGYRSQIFEMHDLPGGLCTAWQRKEYIFDGCIHYLFGSAPGRPFNRLWQELGALQDRTILHHSEFMQVIGGDGRTLIAYCDPDRLERHMLELAPADARQIARFADGVRSFMDFDMSAMKMTPPVLLGPTRGLGLARKMLPFVGPLARWGMLSAQDFGQRFTDPFLRRAIPLLFAWPEIPMVAALALLAYMQIGNAGFPAGGSLEFARAIERRYLALGGEIHYKAQVEKILVENDRAAGVRLYDDREQRADVVISAADGRSTIFDLLGGRYVDNAIRRIYDHHMPVHPVLQVSLGVDRDLADAPHWATYLFDSPRLIAGADRHDIGVKHYCFDPSLAPPGKSVLELLLSTDYAYWQNIYGRKLYDIEQIQVQNQFIGFLEECYPGVRQRVEVVDVATPLSYERYTGNWQGSSCGWLLTKSTMQQMLFGMRKTLPGLGNFHLIGQWVEPGGSVPLVALSGRNVIQLLCHADGRPFVANTPEGA